MTRRNRLILLAPLLACTLACAGVSEVGQRLNASFTAEEIADQIGIPPDRVTCEMLGNTRAFSCTVVLDDPQDADTIASTLNASSVSLADALQFEDGLGESRCRPQHDAQVWFAPAQGDGYGARWVVLSEDKATLCLVSEHLYG